MESTSPFETDAHGVPEQKPGDEQDKSSAGEEDPGAAIEEMHDPNPQPRSPLRP